MRPPTSSRAFFRIYPFVRSRGFAVSIQPSFIRISEDAERHSSEVELTAPKKFTTKCNQGRYTCRQGRDNGGKNTPDRADV